MNIYFYKDRRQTMSGKILAGCSEGWSPGALSWRHRGRQQPAAGRCPQPDDPVSESAGRLELRESRSDAHWRFRGTCLVDTAQVLPPVITESIGSIQEPQTLCFHFLCLLALCTNTVDPKCRNQLENCKSSGLLNEWNNLGIIGTTSIKTSSKLRSLKVFYANTPR